MARIVVGVDGSPGARRALGWAAEEARLRRAVLQVVHAYQARHLAAPFYFPSQHAVPPVTDDVAQEPAQLEMAETMQDRAEFEAVYRRRAEQLLDAMLGELDGDLQVQRTVVEDRHPAEALVSLAADADLLVVGSRGLGGFTALVLGSVSHAAVLQSVCPVVVVPSPSEDGEPGQAPG